MISRTRRPGGRRARRAFLWALFLGPGLASAAVAATLQYPEAAAGVALTGPAYVSTRVLLRLRPEFAHAAYAEIGRAPVGDERRLRRSPTLERLSRRLGGARLEPEFAGETPGGSPDFTTFWIAHLSGALSLSAALDVAAGAPEVLEASPIAVMPLDEIRLDPAGLGPLPGQPGAAAQSPDRNFAVPAPNDSMWNLCYWLQQNSRRDLHALEAWEITRGDPSVTIAILDTGILPYHPDLGGKVAGQPGQLWTNAAETGGSPGVDDDDNGYVDDTWGWDFVVLDSASFARSGEDWRDEDNDPNDFAVHGTAVAGVAAAIANNGMGTAGVAPGVKVMALRVGYSAAANPAGDVELDWAAKAMRYAAKMGAQVINCSFASVQQPDLIAAVQAAQAAGVILCVAAGNNGTPNYLGTLAEILSVTATDQTDHVTLFANRFDWVDVSAPGQSIATTTLRATGTDSIGLRTPSYSPAEAGTSFSAPMLSAAVALLQSDRKARGLPPMTAPLALLRITETADDISSLNPGTGYGSGRLNLQRMLSDPPLSTAFGAGAVTIGPPALLPMQSGRSLVVYATADSALLFMRAATGDTLALVELGSQPVGGVAAADLGPVLGTGVFVGLRDGRIAGYHASGVPLPGWPVDASTTRGDIEAMPALGDLDADGQVEIVWGGDDGNVWAWRADGSRMPGYPRPAGPAGRNIRIALADLDGVPGLEVLAGTNSNLIHAFNRSGVDFGSWPVVVYEAAQSPIVMKLGFDTRPTVIVVGGSYLQAFYANGQPRFLRSYGNSSFSFDPAAGDLNGDGRDEIVAVSIVPSQVASYDTTGAQIASGSLLTRPNGPPLVAPLAIGGGAQVLFPSPDPQGRTRLLAFTGTLGTLPRWPKGGYPSNGVSIADVDGDGATEIAAGAGADGLLYLYDAGPNTWRANLARWTTPRGNFARTGSRLDSPPLIPGDDRAPNPVADLESDEPLTRSVKLRWTAPADPGPRPRLAGYEARVSDLPLDDDNFEKGRRIAQAIVPAAPGAAESLDVSGLRESATQWVAIRCRDEIGNWSTVSPALAITTPTLAPTAVTDLRVVAGGDSSVTFSWTASGDDASLGRPAFYRIRAAETPLDSAAFEVAPFGADVAASADAGRPERAKLGHVPTGRRIYVALRAVDAAGNASPLSNLVAPLVGRLAPFTGIALLPTQNPARVPVGIAWQGAPGWTAGPQRITVYDVNGRRQAQFSLPPQPAGVLQWDGVSYRGERVPPGIYFARLESGPLEARTRIVLLR